MVATLGTPDTPDAPDATSSLHNALQVLIKTLMLLRVPLHPSIFIVRIAKSELINDNKQCECFMYPLLFITLIC